MAASERESIRLLKQTIRKKRVHMGLPPEGQLNVETVVEAMKEQPPVDELVTYIKNALSEDTSCKPSKPSPTPSRKPFDRMA